MNKPTICKECKHYYEIYEPTMHSGDWINYCRKADKTKMNYVTGEMDVIKRKECKKINKDGKCFDFEIKELSDG